VRETCFGASLEHGAFSATAQQREQVHVMRACVCGREERAHFRQELFHTTDDFMALLAGEDKSVSNVGDAESLTSSGTAENDVSCVVVRVRSLGFGGSGTVDQRVSRRSTCLRRKYAAVTTAANPTTARTTITMMTHEVLVLGELPSLDKS
jgi:hypothetical protein